MITYNDIYEALRNERYNEKLQKLGKRFIEDVAEYLEEKKQLTEKEEDVFSDSTSKNKKQLENAVTLFKELMTRRKKKLLNLAFIARETGISKKDFENMLDFEKNLFDKIVKGMKDADKKISEIMKNKKVEESSNVLVRFKEDVEEFLDGEGNKIGPFDEDELANLPKEIVSILRDSEKVEIIE
jgi:DNA replication initiation complex subunit (GINS family)